MKLNEFKNRLLQNSKFRADYERPDIAFEMAKILIDARIERRLTQKKLARILKTKQSGISRLEKGSHLPTLTFLKKIADAYKTTLILPRFGSANSWPYAKPCQDLYLNKSWSRSANKGY